MFSLRGAKIDTVERAHVGGSMYLMKSRNNTSRVEIVTK